MIISNSHLQRCYRLNLERPFDIHAEESPLEYGDYMTPWTIETLPDCAKIRGGPVEYKISLHMESLHLRMAGSHEHDGNDEDTTCLPREKLQREAEEKVEDEAEVTANETARLFRRSALSLHESAERERKGREAVEAHLAAELGIKPKKKASKNLFKSLTKIMAGNGKSANANIGIVPTKPTGRPKKSSSQATIIEKARDLVDEPEYDDGDEHETPNLVSLYIVGEYDLLNDLVKDGAMRLRKKDMPDVQIQEMNEPYLAEDTVTSALARAAAAEEARIASKKNDIPSCSFPEVEEREGVENKPSHRRTESASGVSISAGGFDSDEAVELRRKHSSGEGGECDRAKVLVSSTPAPFAATATTGAAKTHQRHNSDGAIFGRDKHQQAKKKTFGRRVSSILDRRRGNKQ